MSGDADYGSMLKADLEAELEDRGIVLESGSGKNGRVLKEDMAEALSAAAGAGDAVEEASEESSPSEEVDEPAEDEAQEEATNDGDEESDEVRVARVPEVGEIVAYRDQFSGQRSDARVSLVHDKTTVNLALFRGGGADSKTEVPFGQGRGQWSWK